MRRYLLLVFLLAIPHAFAAKEPTSRKPINCSTILAKASRIFGRADDTNAAAYIGLSHENLVALLSTGHLSSSHFVDPPRPRLTKEHPFGAKIIAAQAQYPEDPWSRKEAIGGATHEATRQSRFKIISDRITELTLKPLSPEAQNMLDAILYSVGYIEPAGPDHDKAKLYSPDWPTLRHIFLESSLDFEEPTILDQPIDRKLSRQINTGDNYEELVTDQRMLRFLKAVGIHDNDIEVKNGAAATKLLQFFSSLPTRSGYVIGLKPSKALKQDPNDWNTLENLKIDDVTSIEPLGDDEFAYLAGLAPKPKARKAKADQTK